MAKENVLLTKSFDFARLIVRFHPQLIELKHFEIASQLIRSGTSIGANSREAQRAESRKDFLHKLKISLKEAEETKFWLLLINEEITPVDESLINLNEELIRMLVSITKSTGGYANS